MKKILAASIAALASISVLAPAASGAPAAAESAKAANTSLAQVLTSDGNTFDGNWSDYDIVTEAVLAVLAAKPASPVGVLTDGSVALTAFVPNDRAFRRLWADVSGHRLHSERKVFNKLVASSVSTPSSRCCSTTSFRESPSMPPTR
ncbi:MAG: hypothetical protein V9E81_13980 [Marmoricola sp.]